MLHQVCLPIPDADPLRFLWGKGINTKIEDCTMRVLILVKEIGLVQEIGLLNERHLWMIAS